MYYWKFDQLLQFSKQIVSALICSVVNTYIPIIDGVKSTEYLQSVM